MSIWFTSDQHFGHAKVIEYCNRPFETTDEMDETIIDNFNSVVKAGDIVWHLGDFAVPKMVKEKQIEYVKGIWLRLNGNHEVIKGNHDRWLRLFKKAGVRIPKFNYRHRAHSLKVDLGGEHKQFIELNHYAHAIWNKSHYGSWHLHGHSHGSYKPAEGRILDVGVDVHNYYPIHIDEVKSYMENRVFKALDHHL